MPGFDGFFFAFWEPIVPGADALNPDITPMPGVNLIVGFGTDGARLLFRFWESRHDLTYDSPFLAALSKPKALLKASEEEERMHQKQEKDKK